MKEIISQKIKEGRELKGFTIQEVAEKLGLTKDEIIEYENGYSVPNSDKLLKFSKLFNQQLGYFFELSGNYPQEQPTKEQVFEALRKEEITLSKASQLLNIDLYELMTIIRQNQ